MKCKNILLILLLLLLVLPSVLAQSISPQEEELLESLEIVEQRLWNLNQSIIGYQNEIESLSTSLNQTRSDLEATERELAALKTNSEEERRSLLQRLEELRTSFDQQSEELLRQRELLNRSEQDYQIQRERYQELLTSFDNLEKVYNRILKVRDIAVGVAIVTTIVAIVEGFIIWGR